MANSSTDLLAPKDAEIKQGVINVEKTFVRKIRVPGFKGAFKGVIFDNEGNSDGAVSEELISTLKANYPKLKIEDQK